MFINVTINITDVTNMSIFDEKEMTKRLCPYQGHCTRDRIIHKEGTHHYGTATTKNGMVYPVSARFGFAKKGGDLFGIAVSFRDRSKYEFDVDEGDILLLGKYNHKGTKFFNDINHIETKKLGEKIAKAVASTAFSRTGKVSNFVRLPYKTLGVNPDTVCSLTYVLKNGDKPDDVIDFTSTTDWEMYDVNTDELILTVGVSPYIDDKGVIESGNELLFKHDIPDDPKPPYKVNTFCGTACNIMKLLCCV